MWKSKARRLMISAEHQRNENIQRLNLAVEELNWAHVQFNEAQSPEAVDVACMRLKAAELKVDSLRGEILLQMREHAG